MNADPSAEGHLRELMATQLLAQTETIHNEWERLLEEGRSEGPHRQRTAINKIRTLSRIAEAADTPIPLPEALGRLRKWQKALGPIRDLDVNLEWLESIKESVSKEAGAGAEEFLARLQTTRRGLANQLIPRVFGEEGDEARTAVAEVREWASRNAPSEAPGPDDFAQSARAEISTLLLTPVAPKWLEYRDSAADFMTQESLHDFRLRNKRLRDAAEFLARHVDLRWEPLRDRVQKLHKILGDINDLHVLASRLRSERAARSHHISTGVDPTHRALSKLQRAIDKETEVVFDRLLVIWPELFSKEVELTLRAFDA